jgi:two-component system chemotaxis response regulator CheB
MATWSAWVDFASSQDLSQGPIDPSSFDLTEESEFFLLVVALFKVYGQKLRLTRGNLDSRFQDFIDNPVLEKAQLPADFPLSDLGELGLAGGNGELSDFVSWGRSLRALFEEPIAEKSSRTETRITVLVVDDSPTIHSMMDRWARNDPGVLIVGHAMDAFEAEKLRQQTKPDVMTLDIHMPGKDGIEYLSEMMSGPSPQRVLMLSTITREHAVSALKAFELGAMDYLEKPTLASWDATAATLSTLVRSISKAKPRSLRFSPGAMSRQAIRVSRPEFKMILLGASTGGTEALSELLQEFPANAPPTLIVQHIPPVFSAAFAKRLNELSKIEVVEASDGLVPSVGHAYVAPGGLQMKLERGRDSNLKIRIVDDPPQNRHKPSVDYMFSSAIQARGHLKVVAALLTGMGADGAKELLRLKQSGVHTIAQDEATSVVFGMPGVAVDIGAAAEVVPLPSMAYHLFRALES